MGVGNKGKFNIFLKAIILNMIVMTGIGVRTGLLKGCSPAL